MTIVMHDAKKSLQGQGYELNSKFLIHDLLYADDTLLIEADVNCLELYMKEVEKHGKEYGLTLNCNKVEVLPVRCEPKLQKPDGEEMENNYTETQKNKN